MAKDKVDLDSALQLTSSLQQVPLPLQKVIVQTCFAFTFGIAEYLMLSTTYIVQSFCND